MSDIQHSTSLQRSDFIARADHLLAENATAVLARILAYFQSPPVSAASFHERLFACVFAWVKSGDIKV
jgi:hypothetical protein